MNFAALDLNLLRVFDAMTHELNTGRAGERVGLSQPAVSAALARLRHATGDPLFVRQGNRLVPTARAEALAGPVRAALSALERTLAVPDRFDPATDRRSFRLHGSDYFSTLLMPPLAALAEAEAPGVTLHLLDLPGGPERQLAEGAADLCLNIGMATPDWILGERLFESRLLGVAARGNEALAGVAPGTVVPDPVFAALRHVLVAGDGSTRGSLDADLATRGIARRVALTLPHFHAVALAVAGSGLFAALPEHFARAVAPRLGLDLYELPIPGPRVTVQMYWHARTDRDPGSLWLRDNVRAACATVTATAANVAPPALATS
jgi:DNA-binding transcriptional LysR family regulator